MYDKERKRELKTIMDFALSNYDWDVSSDVMCELLTNPEPSSWKMYENLTEDYIKGNEDFRKGMDDALCILTGWKLSSITEMVKKKCEEEKQ